VTVFVDTSALYALVDRDDAQNGAAREMLARLLEHQHLVTHSYALLECIALTQRRLHADGLRLLVQEILPVIETTIWIDEPRHTAGVAALIAALPSRVSLVDFVSFSLMRELGLTDAFAFDADFTAAGFRTLP
jgi:predicted nucleic acid-binding protein